MFLPALGTIALGSLTPTQVQMALDERGRHAAAATVTRGFAALRAMLNAAVDADLIGRSPARKVALPRIVRSERRTLTPDDLRRLVDELPGHHQTLVLTAGVLGLARRFGERVLRPAAARAGLEGLTFHGLRHAAASSLVDVGVHPRVMATRIGHGTVKVTMEIYARTSSSADREAATLLQQRFASSFDDVQPCDPPAPEADT